MAARACSVVMVSYHTGEALFASIKLALAQEGLAELIVVSNGNPEPHAARLAHWAQREPKLTVLRGHGNIGFAAGCNLGAKHATGGYVALLNPDAMLPVGALMTMMQAFEQFPQAMLAGAQLLNPDGTPQRGGRRNLLTPQSALAESLIVPRWLGLSRLNIHEQSLPDQPHAVPAISGAFMVMRREDYQNVGGMDEGYFLHVEDLDLCCRVQRAGGVILFVPQVKIVHLLSTSEVPGPFVERCKAAGFKRYFAKHFTGQVPAPLLWAANRAIEVRYGLKLLTRPLRQLHCKRESALRKLELLLAAYGDGEASSFFQEKTILVTGASSPLGMCVIGRLLGAGAKVRAVSRHKACAFEHEHLQWQNADLQNFIPQPGIDMAIHCAPIWLLPPHLKALAVAGCRRIVAFGSTSIIGKADSANAYEQRIVEKLQRAENDIAHDAGQYGVGWTVLRPTLIYGGGLDRNISRIAWVIRRLGICLIYPPGSGLRQPVHAQDLAAAALAALQAEQAAGKAYNLSGGETLTYRQMLVRIFAAMGRKPRILPCRALPLALDAAGRMLPGLRLNGEMARRQNRDLAFSHEAAARDLGYTPRLFLHNPRRDLL